MDAHIIPGVKAKDVAAAHTLDVNLQDEHGCKCMTYWIDEERETVFCLIDAPAKETVVELHNKAHGLVPHKIIEVNDTIVQSFLGRIYDPEDAVQSEEGLKIFSDASYRVLLVTQTADKALLRHQLGSLADDLLNKHYSTVRDTIAEFGGLEAEHSGEGFIISFTSATLAIRCALSIRSLHSADKFKKLDLNIAVHGGEPVDNGDTLFAETIQFAGYLNTIAPKSSVAISATLKELVSKDLKLSEPGLYTLNSADERFLQQLFQSLEQRWQDPDFDVENYCSEMAMSKSQLYRKTIALTGMSSNILLKDFRLCKAREMLKKSFYNVSQVTFDCGFTSPSYFTKCFKKKFDVLPMQYVNLLNRQN